MLLIPSYDDAGGTHTISACVVLYFLFIFFGLYASLKQLPVFICLTL